MKKSNAQSAIREFGESVTRKLANIGVTGEPEEQLRAPFERLVKDMAELVGYEDGEVVVVGETPLAELKTRPDFAVRVGNAPIGFIELKSPGKGADPRSFREAHDRAQWEKLRSLPNLLYTDGNAFSLWQNGELAHDIIRLEGDVRSQGGDVVAPAGLQVVFAKFLRWQPIPPRSARELARTTALLCKLLRDEVTEQLGRGSESLSALARDWRVLLFPEASDETFADGYAQAVTFGLLLARANDIPLAGGLPTVSARLARTHSLIGTALRLLTDNAESQETLKTSLGTLVRVLDAVSWAHVSKGDPDAWLYFYEEFLEVYDNDLRKQTGSYYTPPEVVRAMVRLVDELLRSARFKQPTGLASPAVTICDPAMGTGTFLLGILRHIADAVETDEGQGAVYGAVNDSARRLVAFEAQLGPFAVAQLRVFAEIVELTRSAPQSSMRMFVTDTLGDPAEDKSWFPAMLAPIATSKKEADKIKRDVPITVVIGNPPYKEKAKGRGGWIEGSVGDSPQRAPLVDWMPPRDWGVGAHAKHLRNLYVYFWRWATWKVFDHHAHDRSGVVCYITVAGFLTGPGFEKMRDYLRRTCDDIWVIDCSPEGHQPEVAKRVFQGVQQPVCIVLASRSPKADTSKPAHVRFTALASADRKDKFKALSALRLESGDWQTCSTDWRAPFTPSAKGAWATYPSLDAFFLYNGSGVMPGRTWVIAPDRETLVRRWKKLVDAPVKAKDDLFQPHMNRGELGDRHVNRRVEKGLAGHTHRAIALAADRGACVPPIRYGFRTLDRQFIIPDSRLINRPNPDLWALHSDEQVYITALSRVSPSSGPALTVTALIPDLDHYKGSFGGRAFPMLDTRRAGGTNIPPRLLEVLSEKFGREVGARDMFAYIVGIASHAGYIARFEADLATPGLKVPLTATGTLFDEVAELGRRSVWAQTFGERFVDVSADRPAGPPRLPKPMQPRVPASGAIPQSAESMPDTLEYDPGSHRLMIGSGFVENVSPQMWAYEVSGKRVLTQWFSYRRRDRSRPLIGDKRPPSELTSIQPDHWLPEYTTELLNVLNVIGVLVALEPAQADALQRVVAGPTISAAELGALGPFDDGHSIVRESGGLFDE